MAAPPPRTSYLGRAPDKGSFPLDHFGECASIHKDYVACLFRHQYDNTACRFLAKKYLQCRMDNGLMSKEPLTRLGFTEDEDHEKETRDLFVSREKESKGFRPGLSSVKPHSIDLTKLLPTSIYERWKAFRKKATNSIEP